MIKFYYSAEWPLLMTTEVAFNSTRDDFTTVFSNSNTLALI